MYKRQVISSRLKSPGLSDLIPWVEIPARLLPFTSPTAVKLAVDPVRFPLSRIGLLGIPRDCSSSARSWIIPDCPEDTVVGEIGGLRRSSNPSQATLSQPVARVKITAIARCSLCMRSMESGMIWGSKPISASFRGNLMRGALLTQGGCCNLMCRCLKYHP